MDKLRSSRLLAILVVGFVAATIMTGILAYTTVRDYFASRGEFEQTGFAPVESGDQAAAAPGQAPRDFSFDPSAPLQGSGPAALDWDGESRVTILLMGLDFRDWEQDTTPARTDTLMLVTLDPASRTAGMLSIPRDMWVAIPGFEHGKINTAYQLGEIYDVEGGGAAVTIQAVEQLIGVPINYYALIDFGAFVRIIDEIGGVKIDVPDRIGVDLIGPKNFKVIQPGRHTLSGELALAYVRARNTIGGDFDRAWRQQQVLLGVRDRVLDFDLLPELISKAPVLYQELAGSINTNLSLEQAIKMGVISQQVPENNIARGVIGLQQVTIDKSPQGLDILKPIPDKIRLIRDDVFASGNIAPNLLAQEKTPEELIEDENARISVLNGTQAIGLASQTSEYLQQNGLNITVTDNASQFYNITTVIDYSGKPYTLQYLVELMDINPNQIFHSYDPDSNIDIEINLGDDWADFELTP